MAKQNLPYDRMDSSTIIQIQKHQEDTRQIKWAIIGVVLVILVFSVGCNSYNYIQYIRDRDVQQHIDIQHTDKVQVDTNPKR